MGYEAELMNIRIVAPIHSDEETIEYKMGFRDARHMAAVIGMRADREIAELKLKLKKAQYQ